MSLPGDDGSIRRYQSNQNEIWFFLSASSANLRWRLNRPSFTFLRSFKTAVRPTPAGADFESRRFKAGRKSNG
jgi:hypothetical protein